MKSFIATVLVTLFMFNVSMAQKLKETEGNPEGEISEFAFNQTIGSFQEILYTVNSIKGDLYLKGFQSGSMEPLFTNRIGFSMENTDKVLPLDVVLTTNGIMLLGYEITKDFNKIVFYAQEFNERGEIERDPKEILSLPYSKKVSNQSIKVSTSQDVSKVALSFFRKNAKQKHFVADIIVYDVLEQSVHKTDMKVVQKEAVAKSSDFEFNVFIRNMGDFITVFEENIYDLNEEHKHTIQAFIFDSEGTQMNELDFSLDGVELYKPHFSENNRGEGFKVTGFFTSSRYNNKAMPGFLGVSSIHFSDEDYQRIMEFSSPFSEKLLENSLNVHYEKQGGLSRKYMIDYEGRLANGQNYLTCSFLRVEESKGYAVINIENILLISFGREPERNFETVIEKPLSAVYVKSSNMSEKYISYPEWSLKTYTYYTQSDYENVFILYKEVEEGSLVKGDNTVTFNTQISARSIENGEENISIMKELYQEDPFLFYLKAYGFFNSDRFKGK